ncbi:MAG: hypothetical protein ACM3PF_11445 [Bacteroidota bacterium]
MTPTQRRPFRNRSVAAAAAGRACALATLALASFAGASGAGAAAGAPAEGSTRVAAAADNAGSRGGAPGLDAVPDSVGALIHLSTTRLPPFPNDNPGLLDPGRWADAAGDSGMICALELRTYARGSAVPIRSIRQRKEGQSLSARYLCSAPGWRGPHYSGPFYVWGQHDELVQRSYRTTDGKRYREDLYQYRENGLLWAYRHRERNEDESGPALTLDEYFGLDGKLAGFQLERTGPDSTLVAWRRGARVDEAEFRKWAGEFAPK